MERRCTSSSSSSLPPPPPPVEYAETYRDPPPSLASNEDDDRAELEAKLLEKRKAAARDVEAYKRQKEKEVLEYENTLRLDYKQRWKNGGEGKKKPKEEASVGTNVVPDFGGSFLEDTLRDGEKLQKKQSANIASNGPPFERELEETGLFTPSYLPLLERTRNKQVDAGKLLPSPMEETENDDTHEQQSGSPARRSVTSGSPSLPLVSTFLVSSLRSSSSGSVGDTSSRRPPKSPKKVTFRFEDESSVPSRSSPPEVRYGAVWKYGPSANADDGFEDVDDGEDISDDEGALVGEPIVYEDDDDPEADDNLVEQVEDVGSRVEDQPRIGQPGVASPARLSTSSSSSSSSSSAPPHPPPAPATTRMSNGNHHDEEDALFDLDETMPEARETSPPHRDFQALMDPPSPLSPRISESVPRSTNFPPSFSSSPINATTEQQRRASLSGSLDPGHLKFTHIPFKGVGTPYVPDPPVPSSLPVFPKYTEKGRFRRRTVHKYIPSPPPEKEDKSKGKAKGKGKPKTKGKGRAKDKDESSGSSTPDPEEFVYGSPYAASVPVTITPRVTSPPSGLPPIEDGPPKPKLNTDEEALLASTSPNTTAALLAADTRTTVPMSREVESFKRTATFPSARTHGTNYMSQYVSLAAREVAEQAEIDGDVLCESVIGGVNGSTGLDPGGSIVSSIGGVGSYVGRGPSLSQRLALEEEWEKIGRRF